MNLLRKPIRKLLLRIFIWTEKKSKPIVTGNLHLWHREIHIHPYIIISVNAILIFAALIFEIGPVPTKLAGLLIFVFISFSLFIIYLKKHLTDLIKDNDAMMLLGILTSLSVLLIETIKSISTLSPFVVPLAGIIMLATLLLGYKTGLILAISMSFLCGLLYNFKLEFLFYHLTACLVAVNLAGKIYHRQDITIAGGKIILINILTIITISFLGKVPNTELHYNILWAGVNGIILIVFVLGLLSPLEMFFSRITNIKLIELTDFNQPLIKRLMMEAPGTYHHSIMVATLAEAVEANALLARAGAFYHDIGKLVKPEYFIENQSQDNPHDNINPSMSGLVVTAHVKEGVNLAHKSNLDKPIIDMIEQHHGTSLIHMFYKKALENVDNAEEARFRYPGPKPKTKESAILMLADSCEAALRMSEKPSASRIKETVEKVINNKFIDGQLNNSPLSLSDMHIIAESIISTLTGMHHTRTDHDSKSDQPKENGKSIY